MTEDFKIQFKEVFNNKKLNELTINYINFITNTAKNHLETSDELIAHYRTTGYKNKKVEAPLSEETLDVFLVQNCWKKPKTIDGNSLGIVEIFVPKKEKNIECYYVSMETLEIISHYAIEIGGLEQFSKKAIMSGWESYFLYIYWNDEEIRNFFDAQNGDKKARREITKYLSWYLNSDNYKDHIKNFFEEENILKMLANNPQYKDIAEERLLDIENRKLMVGRIQKAIPDDITTYYPIAKKLKRHFVLHIGPTNSGKTHDALCRLEEVDSGVYLAPLRLMAYENYLRLNKNNVPCNMITGEEIIPVEGAKHSSMTIEMLGVDHYYDVAVIDEAQMIEDTFRGGAWTSAILGVNSPEIHICMAENARDIVVKLIEMCGDTYTEVYHERKTKLEFENFQGKFRKGDALVLFSRRDVIHCAADLQKNGYKCSILYGMLPYDVRFNEMNNFVEGKTDILVTTDVIGMGMNLPIRRIIFLSSEKFDGQERRYLNATEIKQIGGRAGRYGLYDVGYVASLENPKLIKSGLSEYVPPISRATLGFPENLINIPGKLSVIIEQWKALVPEDNFRKTKIEDMVYLASLIERKNKDKKLIYDFITMTFDAKSTELLQLWLRLFTKYNENKELCIDDFVNFNNTNILTFGDLSALELEYRELDLCFNCFRKFGKMEDLKKIMERKNLVVKRINEILSKQKLQGRTCKYCGKKLPWNHPYGMCQKCYEDRYLYNYDYDYYDFY